MISDQQPDLEQKYSQHSRLVPKNLFRQEIKAIYSLVFVLFRVSESGSAPLSILRPLLQPGSIKIARISKYSENRLIFSLSSAPAAQV